MSHCRNTLNFIQNFREISTQAFVEGEMGVYGIAVLSFFSNGISLRYLVKEDPSQYCETVHCALSSTASQYFQDLTNGK